MAIVRRWFPWPPTAPSPRARFGAACDAPMATGAARRTHRGSEAAMGAPPSCPSLLICLPFHRLVYIQVLYPFLSYPAFLCLLNCIPLCERLSCLASVYLLCRSAMSMWLNQRLGTASCFSILKQTRGITQRHPLIVAKLIASPSKLPGQELSRFIKAKSWVPGAHFICTIIC